MGSLSSLTEKADILLVADASVVINLNATQYPEALLDALPNRIVVSEVVKQELSSGRSRWNSADTLSNWSEAHRIEVVQLGEVGKQHFRKLVDEGGAQTLDDGEAATIAYALEYGDGATPLIDDEKAIKVCSTHYPKLTIGCTLDLLAHNTAATSLGRKNLANAVFNALKDARMRVMPRFEDWVVDLIGTERTAKCPSLRRSVRSLR